MDASHIEHFYADEAKSNIASASMDHPLKHEGAQLSAHEADTDLAKLLNRGKNETIGRNPNKSNPEEGTINPMIPDSKVQTSKENEASYTMVEPEPSVIWEQDPTKIALTAVARRLLTHVEEDARTDRYVEIHDPKASKAQRLPLEDLPDTLVFIDYPKTAAFQKFLNNNYPFHIHSAKLLATGSQVFQQLLSPTSQFRTLRRRKLAKQLPKGLKYVLDLTPPDEGDEAVNIIADLSLSMGIRRWYTMEHWHTIKCNAIGGSDESLVSDLLPILGRDTEPPIQKRSYGRAPRMDLNPRNQMEADADLQAAILLSQNAGPNEGLRVHAADSVAVTLTNYYDDTPEYSDVRHRLGIQRLLQIIEGGQPNLDSAPKVWTLWTLAKHFDCISIVVDPIKYWMTTRPNSVFVEVLPEMSARIGLGLQISSISKAAFSVLVGEEALSLIGNHRLRTDQEWVGMTLLGRQREDIDEDLKNRIEYASKAFEERISKRIDEAFHKDLLWLEQLPEYRKILRFEKAISRVEHTRQSKWLKSVHQLKELIISFIRHQIIHALSLEIDNGVDSASFIAHRSLDALLLNDWGNATSTLHLYNRLSMRERAFTRPFWNILKRNTFALPNYLRSLNKQGEAAAQQENLTHVTNQILDAAARNFDTAILESLSSGCLTADDLKIEELPASAPDSSSGEGPRQKKARFEDNGHGPTFSADVESSLAAFKFKQNKSTVSASYHSAMSDIAFRTASTDLGVHENQKVIQPQKLNVRQSEGVDFTGSWNHRLNTRSPHTITVNPVTINPATKRTVPSASTPGQVRLQNLVYLDKTNPTTTKPPSPGPSDWYPTWALHFLNLSLLFDEVDEYFQHLAYTMLGTENMGFDVQSTDVLVCLTDNEFKYLPVFAGGQDDGTGAVFTEPLPEGVSGVVPIGPGPFFKTGFSVGGSSCFDTDADSESASTIYTGEESGDGSSSRGVEDGFSGAFPQLRVMGREDMGSIAWSDAGSTDVGDGEWMRQAKGKGKIFEMGPIFTPGTSTVGGSSAMGADNRSVIGENVVTTDAIDESTSTPPVGNSDDENDNGNDDNEDYDYDTYEDDDDNETMFGENQHLDVDVNEHWQGIPLTLRIRTGAFSGVPSEPRAYSEYA